MVQQNLAESYTLATESGRIQNPLLSKNRKHTFKKTWKIAISQQFTLQLSQFS